ncbi:hypothetical protein V0U79_06090 [Hyphobacterium sp. HN65]|uniref:Uncharacterized protein n=1 Tax=Hyphobacterium lacteum TaxID=3116575 RepID=A0ABU7LRH7_9PROT|nr:hypothetical protein [Hyphobacterium sp. HN65]MEE2525929.1 hypothetical protein [Hyphobacterium sp. HN65]
MILARLSKAFREQNWFAVALEFVIVIAGVVIGFQITAWNTERSDRDRELSATIQSYYAEYADLQNNLGSFRDIRAAALPVLYRHGFSLFSEHELAPVLAAARTDPEFMAYIRTARELAWGQISIAMGREAEARALLEQIDTETAP